MSRTTRLSRWILDAYYENLTFYRFDLRHRWSCSRRLPKSGGGSNMCSMLPDHLRLLGQDVTETERADQNNPTTAAAMVAAEKPTTMATKYATISSRALACQCLPLFQPSQILNTRPTPLLVWRGAAQRRVRSQPQLRVVWYHSLVRCCTGLNAGCMRRLLRA